MKTFNYIYLITNKVNGMIYIGQHITDDLNDGYMGSGLLINRALKKYGPENFTKEYLAFCDTKDTLDYLEKYYIKKYKALDKNIGYNILSGGHTYERTDATKKLVGEKLRRPHPWAVGEKNPMYGKNAYANKTPEEMRIIGEKISKKLKGKVWSEESRRKNSEAHKHPKEKYEWLTPTGEIKLMDPANAHKHHPDWILKSKD